MGLMLDVDFSSTRGPFQLGHDLILESFGGSCFAAGHYLGV